MDEGPAVEAVIVADPSGRGHLLQLPALVGGQSSAAGPVSSAANLIASALDNAALLGNGPLQGAVLLEAGSWQYDRDVAKAALSRAEAEVAKIEVELDRLCIGACCGFCNHESLLIPSLVPKSPSEELLI
jgi:hypothetical protein